MAAEDIGCSLAEAAQSASYDAYLADAGKVKNAVHVIYINTGLDTKGGDAEDSHHHVHVIKRRRHRLTGGGADSGRARTTARTRTWVATWLSFATHDDVGRRGHQSHAPAHDRDTIKSLLPRLKYFDDGTCMVHDMFGKDVCDTVRSFYGDAYQTAHFEVPGEMFKLAMEAKDADSASSDRRKTFWITRARAWTRRSSARCPRASVCASFWAQRRAW